MNDPTPENIAGEKKVIHRVNHEVNWSHVAIAAAVVYAGWKAAQWQAQRAEGESESGDGDGVAAGLADDVDGLTSD